jgi:hypothetical protein
MTGVDHPDPPTEIDQPVAVGIGDYRAFGMNHSNRGNRRNAPRHRLGAARQQCSTLGAGYFGLEMDHARHQVLMDQL